MVNSEWWLFCLLFRKVKKAAFDQMDQLWHTTNIYLHPKIHEYAEKLIAKLPPGLDVSIEPRRQAVLIFYLFFHLNQKVCIKVAVRFRAIYGVFLHTNVCNKLRPSIPAIPGGILHQQWLGSKRSGDHDGAYAYRLFWSHLFEVCLRFWKSTTEKNHKINRNYLCRIPS